MRGALTIEEMAHWCVVLADRTDMKGQQAIFDAAVTDYTMVAERAGRLDEAQTRGLALADWVELKSKRKQPEEFSD